MSTNSKNPKLIISQYFDSLIRNIDIYTEEQLAKHTEHELLQLPLNELAQNRYNNPEGGKQKQKNESDDLDLTSIEEDILAYGSYDNLFPYKMPEFDFKINTQSELSNEFKSMKIVEYLNQARDEMLDELGKVQEEIFRRFEATKSLIPKRSESSSDAEWRETVKEKVFAEKFTFIVENRNSKFNFYLFVLDFYLNKKDREILR